MAPFLLKCAVELEYLQFLLLGGRWRSLLACRLTDQQKHEVALSCITSLQ